MNDHEVRDRTYIAMNSAIESLRYGCGDMRRAVVSVACSLDWELWMPIGVVSFSNELNATRRVYNHPMLRQNLIELISAVDIAIEEIDLLSKSFAQFPSSFHRPPPARDHSCPHHSHYHGSGTMICNVHN